MKECPFCLRPIGNDAVECPHCHNQVDIFRTGYFARPDLSRPKTAIIWVVAIVVVALLAIGLYRGCAVSRRADTSSDHGRGSLSPTTYARRHASGSAAAVSPGRSAAL